MADHLTITKRYHATWLDVAPDCLDTPGVSAVPSSERAVRQAGYSRPFVVYAYVAGPTAVISYHTEFADRVDALATAFEDAAEPAAIIPRLPDLLGVRQDQVGHATKFAFTALPEELDTSAACRLTRDDWEAFLDFHQAQYPGANQETWLPAYFANLVDRSYLYGVWADGKLVSAAEVPDVPYMADLVAEPGVATLAAYRRRGHARAAVGALLRRILTERKTPLWSCAADNVASRGLAEGVGFAKLADVITVTIDGGD